MIVGLSIQDFTLLHVAITLVAIASGIIVLFGMLGAHRLPGWTALFLVTTILTSVTGFMFPIHGFTPALGVGIISLVILAVALLALYSKHLVGAWRWIYVATAVTAHWFNVFVLIVQSFQKIAALRALAPTQTEPPFLVAQGVALAAFLVLGILAASRFRPAAISV
jgi:phosphoglycerol transferase MdoB-like AlkP superfamily enzyme